MTTRLAFKLGKYGTPGSMIGDWLICLVTGKPFSHCELVESLVPIGSEVYSTMLSSSLRDGGVRGVTRKLVPGRWVVVEFDGDSKQAVEYIKGRFGIPYGWFDLLSFLLPWRVSWSGSDFCSEVIAASFGLPEPWHTSPGTLYDWAMAQDGARIVPDEELRARWVAE